MSLEEYKFIVPETESNEAKIERLKSELISMEEHYKMQEDAGVSEAKLGNTWRMKLCRTRSDRASRSIISRTPATLPSIDESPV